MATVRARIGWKALTAAEYVPEGYTFLSTPNIKGDQIDFENVNYITEHRYQESPELRLMVGDVLLVKDGNTLGITNLVRTLPRPATVNGSIALLRATGIEPGFLRYVLASGATQGLIGAVKDGMGVPHLFQRDINRLPMPLPPAVEQRRITAFLDEEAARIDGLVAKRRRLIRLARERLVAHRESVLAQHHQVQWTPLHHLTDPQRPIVYGIVQAGEEVPSGVPYIRTGDLAPLVPEALSRTSAEIDLAYRRARVYPGDIVIAMRASIGVAVVIPPDLQVANLTQGTARIAPRDGISTEWLFQALATRSVQEQCHVRAVGTTFKTLNIWDLRRISIPLLPDQELRRIATQDVEREAARVAGLASVMESQATLLVERRKALITAAVTGQLDVTTARGAA